MKLQTTTLCSRQNYILRWSHPKLDPGTAAIRALDIIDISLVTSMLLRSTWYMQKPPNPPSRHHYIPEFYLKRWTDTDGKLTVFTKKPRIGPSSRRTAPAGTGYQRHLYAVQGFPPELASSVEERFFNPVDSLAADKLHLMEVHGEKLLYTLKQRRA